METKISFLGISGSKMRLFKKKNTIDQGSITAHLHIDLILDHIPKILIKGNLTLHHKTRPIKRSVYD